MKNARRYLGYALASAPVAVLMIATYVIMPFEGFAFVWGAAIGSVVCILAGTYLLEQK